MWQPWHGTPEGKRRVGRPKTTWRRTVESERNSLGWNGWGTARTVARDRTRWKDCIGALCANGYEEDRWGEVTPQHGWDNHTHRATIILFVGLHGKVQDIGNIVSCLNGDCVKYHTHRATIILFVRFHGKVQDIGNIVSCLNGGLC